MIFLRKSLKFFINSDHERQWCQNLESLPKIMCCHFHDFLWHPLSSLQFFLSLLALKNSRYSYLHSSHLTVMSVSVVRRSISRPGIVLDITSMPRTADASIKVGTCGERYSPHNVQMGCFSSICTQHFYLHEPVYLNKRWYLYCLSQWHCC